MSNDSKTIRFTLSATVGDKMVGEVDLVTFVPFNEVADGVRKFRSNQGVFPLIVDALKGAGYDDEVTIRTTAAIFMMSLESSMSSGLEGALFHVTKIKGDDAKVDKARGWALGAMQARGMKGPE